MNIIKIFFFLISFYIMLTACETGVPEKVIHNTIVPQNTLLNKSLLRHIDRLQVEELQRFDIVSRLPFCRNSRFQSCITPAQTQDADIDIDRSLFVHDVATLTGANFSLNRTLGQMASQVVTTAPGTTALSIFKQFWDTQNASPGVTGTANPHCDDDSGRVNGYPYSCRSEGNEAVGTDAQVQTKMDLYTPVALINRLDLAHQGWRNCGEYRIIYGKQTTTAGRNFIIFEAVLPNPKPGCRSGCIKVAEFWKSLSAIASASERAIKLSEFFYDGLPGYRPVVHVDHYSTRGAGSTYGSSGSGQIRTNQFITRNWALREFKTVLDCGSTPCKFQIVPTMVKVNPHKELWRAGLTGEYAARANSFQSNVLGQIPSLARNSLMDISYSVALDHNAAQSISDGPSHEDYLGEYNAGTGAFKTNFRLNSEAQFDAIGVMLSDEKIIRRALTQTCAGCHEPRTFGLTNPDSIGAVITPTSGITDRWPSSLVPGFVHISESPSSGVFFLSPALTDHFLPARKQFFLAQLNRTRCSCNFCFPFTERILLDKIQFIQEEIDRQFAMRIEELITKMRVTKSNHTRMDLQKHLDKLMLERDIQFENKLKANRIKSPVISLKPQALNLTASKQAKGNLKMEQRLRQKEIMAILKKEPPRRTVTGSFRVH